MAYASHEYVTSTLATLTITIPDGVRDKIVLTTSNNLELVFALQNPLPNMSAETITHAPKNNALIGVFGPPERLHSKRKLSSETKLLARNIGE